MTGQQTVTWVLWGREAGVCGEVPDLDLQVPAVHLCLQDVDDLSFAQQHLLLLMELLLQGLQQLNRGTQTHI